MAVDSAHLATPDRRLPWRLAALIVAAIVIAVVSTIGITRLRDGLDRSHRAESAAAQIRIDTLALVAVELMGGSRPELRPALTGWRAETAHALDGHMAELAEHLADPALTGDVRAAVDAFKKVVDRSNGRVDTMGNPATSLPYLAWFRLDGALTAAEGSAARRADRAGRNATIGTWFIMGLATLLVALLAGRIASERTRVVEFAARAATDHLTGLANRGGFQDELERAVASGQDGGRPVSLLFIDLDRFKAVNDDHGHPVGDQVLVEVAGRLRKSIRAGDTLARLGGDEFAWLLCDCDDQGAIHVGEHALRILTAEPFEGVGTVTASIGVATLTPGQDADALVRAADASLYRAKRSGRGRVDVESPASVPVG